MPQVINGTGTWYYGKRNIHRYRDSCEFCNRLGDLESYDTTLYFVVVFIPVIPLGQKRILSSCPSCQQHRAVALKKWEKLKIESVTSTLDKLKENPDSSEDIIAALLNATYFQDEKLFNKLVQLSEGKQDDAKVQSALGSAYIYFSRYDEAIEAYLRSLKAEDSKLVRQFLAECFLRKGDPANAARLLDHVFDDKNADALWLVQGAIHTHQGLGEHAEALDLMDRRDAAFPDFVNDKEFRKERKLSEKNIDTGKKVRGANFLNSNKAGTSDGSQFGAKVAKFIFPILVLLGASIYFWSAYQKGNHQRVFLINGSSVPYDVTINGTPVNLSPMGGVEQYVPQGLVTVETKTPGLEFEPVQVTIATDFWTRPFDDTVFIINPDRLAPITQETSTYAENNPPVNPPATLHIGEGFYQLPKPNFLFVPFPATIKLKQGERAELTRIGIQPILAETDRLSLLKYAKVSEENQVAYIQRCVKAKPDDAVMLAVLTTKMPEPQFLEFLSKGLDRRPVPVNWHRAYQTTMEKQKPNVDLEPLYAKLLTETNSADAMYLLGRITTDDAKAISLFTQAANANPASAYGMYALGYRALGSGDFPEAVKWLERATQALPQEIQFHNVYIKALFATKAYDRILQLPPAPGEGFSFDAYQAAVMKKDPAAMAAQEQAILSKIQQLLAKSGNQPRSTTVMETIRLSMTAVRAAAQGDIAMFISNQPPMAEGPSFFVNFLKGDLAAAAKQIDGARDDDELTRRGLIYLAARKKKNTKLADEQWSLLIKKMATMDRDSRAVAKILASDEAPDVKKLRDSRMLVEEKRIVLLLAADRFPDVADQLLPLVNKLDFEADPTALCFKQLRQMK